jgi:hypothetical protein
VYYARIKAKVTPESTWIRCEQSGGESVRPAVAVHVDGMRLMARGRQALVQHHQGVLLGVARVDHDGLIQNQSQLYLSLERTDLCICTHIHTVKR